MQFSWCSFFLVASSCFPTVFASTSQFPYFWDPVPLERTVLNQSSGLNISPSLSGRVLRMLLIWLSFVALYKWAILYCTPFLLNCATLEIFLIFLSNGSPGFLLIALIAGFYQRKSRWQIDSSSSARHHFKTGVRFVLTPLSVITHRTGI